MESSMKHFGENERNSRHSRRDFIGKGLKLSIVSGIARVGLLTGCEGEKEGEEDEEVSPSEDLMRSIMNV